MKHLLALIIVCLLISCKGKPKEVSIKDLSGYWQIENVILKDGTKRDFVLSNTIDFIEVIGDTNGVRKKVAPKLDGTFTTSKSAETFSIKIENDSVNLYYKTPFNSWKETIVSLTDSTLIVINKDANRYSYKRFKSFTFE